MTQEPLSGRQSGSAFPWYPVALAAAVVLGAYTANQVPLDQVWRPLTVSLTIVATVLVGAALVGRSHGVSLTLAGSVLLVVGLWPVLLLLIGAVIALGWWTVRNRAGSVRLAELAPKLNVVASMWLVVSIVLTAATATARPTVEPTSALAVARSPASRPNVYLLLLDGYPRADSLREYFNYGNDPFIHDLEDRGFVIAAGSRAAATTTFQSVPSLLHMRSPAALGLVPFYSTPAERTHVRDLINESPAVATFREAGYSVVSIPSGAGPLELRDADVVVEVAPLSALETSLIDGGIVNVVATNALYEIRRRTVDAAFDAFASSPSLAPSPRFVFAHVMSPHAPFAFSSTGAALPPLACAPWCDMGTAQLPALGMTMEEIAGPLIGQLEYVNGRVLEAVDAVVAHDPDAVIVIFSDHGARLDPDDVEEWHRTFFAARLPGTPNAFGDSPTLATVLSTLFDVYFDKGTTARATGHRPPQSNTR
ncbi:MAG TPA: hypothetical protein VHR55_12930 [Candidatus Limnocylindria bacterium]|nr:hypothetical protein [Candidatus Limnocylindria bacterium]